jgi:hypothetical protein
MKRVVRDVPNHDQRTLREGIMNRIPTIVVTALLMLAGTALTGTSTVAAQTGPRGPFGVRADVDGTTVTLSWDHQGTNIFLEVFIRQGPRIFAGWVGAVATVSGTLPPGNYSFTISTDGSSRLAGADFTVQGDAPGGAPGVPATPVVTVSGLLVTLIWAAPSSGGAVVDYLLEAGTAPGASNIAIIPVAGLAFSTTAPPGIYYVRVRARGPAGVGPPSADATINVTAGAPVPGGAPLLTFTITPNPVPLTGVFPGCAGSPFSNKTWVYTLRITNQGTAPFSIASFSTRVTSPLLPAPVDVPGEDFAAAFGASTIPPQGALQGPLCVAGNYDNATQTWTFVDISGAVFTTPAIQFLRAPF